MGAKWEWDKKKCKGECQCWHDFDAFLLTNEILGKRPTASECDDLIYDVLEPEFGLYLCHMRLFLCNGQISKHQTKNFDQKNWTKKHQKENKIVRQIAFSVNTLKMTFFAQYDPIETITYHYYLSNFLFV